MSMMGLGFLLLGGYIVVSSIKAKQESEFEEEYEPLET